MQSEDVDELAFRADALTEDHLQLMAKLIGARKKHQLSQGEVAERMGVSQPTVAGFERYDSNPTLSTIRRYAMAVGVRLRTTIVDDCTTCGDNVAFRAIAAGEPYLRQRSNAEVSSVDAWSSSNGKVYVDV